MNRLTRPAVAILLLLTAFASGYAIGARQSSHDAREVRLQSRSLPRAVEPAAPAVERREHAHAHEAAASAAPEMADQSQEALLERLSREQNLSDRQALAAELVRRLKENPAMLERILAQFQSERDPAALAAWIQVLGRVNSDAVRTLMQTMALDSQRPRESRIAALRVLETQATACAVPVVRQLLQCEHDAGVLTAAMYALPTPRGLSAGECAGVAGLLSQQATQSGDTEVRRTAVLALSDWTHDPSSRTTLSRALETDASARVRAAAAFGLIYVTPKDRLLKAALAAKVQDRTEAWEVRENSWRALGAEGTLDEDLAQVYRQFADEKRGR